MKMQFTKRTKDAPSPSKLGIKCLKCGDELFSYYTHDSKSCSCNACYIDGGDSYTRIGGNAGDWKYIRYDRQEVK